MSSDSIVEVGFLSPILASYERENRGKFAALFGLCEDLNRIGQKVVVQPGLKVTERRAVDANLIAYLLLVRTQSNFQGVILFAKRGMVVEARTLARCCYENVYYLAGLQKSGQQFVDAMIAADRFARKSTSNWLLQKPSRLEHAPGGAEKLKEYLAGLESGGEQAAKLGFEQAAKLAGIDDLYALYKQLSWDAAHPNLEALSRYFVGPDDGSGDHIVWGPECSRDDVGATLDICLPAAFTAVIITVEMLSLTAVHEEASALWARYKAFDRAAT